MVDKEGVLISMLAGCAIAIIIEWWCVAVTIALGLSFWTDVFWWALMTSSVVLFISYHLSVGECTGKCL
jgi:hypothetical protein